MTEAGGLPEIREPAHTASPRARTMWTLGAACEGGAVVLAVGVAVVLWSWSAWLLLPTALLAAVWAVLVPRWRYAVHRWEATDAAVHTQSGWWARERRIAPMSRVQTIDLSEGPLERLFGLASVTVTTASAAGALAIVGLERDAARQLASDLTRQADAVPGDAT